MKAGHSFFSACLLALSHIIYLLEVILYISKAFKTISDISPLNSLLDLSSKNIILSHTQRDAVQMQHKQAYVMDHQHLL